MDHNHDYGQNCFTDVVNFKVSETFYSFEKSLDLVELCMLC